MLSRWYASLPATNKCIVLIAAALICFSVVKSGYYTLHYGGTDLRNRVVGSRLLSTDKSPYFYKWSPGDPERLADPNEVSNRLVNGVTLAPGTLWFQSLFTALDYPLIRLLWTAFLYLLACCIFWSVLADKNNSANANLHIIVIGGILFLCTPLWFLNIERGQIYLLFAFFFGAIYYLCQQKKPWAYFSAGVLIAIAVYCRPNMIVIILPFLLTYNRTVLAGVAAAAIPLALHAYLHAEVWKDYALAMSLYSTDNTTNPVAAAPVHYPSVIEGAKNLTLYKTDFVVGGISPLKYWLPPVLANLTTGVFIGLYAVVVLLLTALFRKKITREDSSRLILFSFLLYLFSEYLSPTTRNPYTIIEWLFPVLLILKKDYLSGVQIILLITGLCLINSFPFYLPYLQALGELLLLYCLFISLSSDTAKISLIQK